MIARWLLASGLWLIAFVCVVVTAGFFREAVRNRDDRFAVGVGGCFGMVLLLFAIALTAVGFWAAGM